MYFFNILLEWILIVVCIILGNSWIVTSWFFLSFWVWIIFYKGSRNLFRTFWCYFRGFRRRDCWRRVICFFWRSCFFELIDWIYWLSSWILVRRRWRESCSYRVGFRFLFIGGESFRIVGSGGAGCTDAFLWAGLMRFVCDFGGFGKMFY